MIELHEENFEDMLVEHETILVQFKAAWCPISNKLADAWEKAAKMLEENENSAKLATINAPVSADPAAQSPSLKTNGGGAPASYAAKAETCFPCALVFLPALKHRNADCLSIVSAFSVCTYPQVYMDITETYDMHNGGLPRFALFRDGVLGKCWCATSAAVACFIAQTCTFSQRRSTRRSRQRRRAQLKEYLTT